MSGRLDDALLDRFVEYAARVMMLIAKLEEDGRPRRVIDQLSGSGTSPGAQMHEADEAVSRPDFLKSIGWAAKELSQTRFWLKLILRTGWLRQPQVAPLLDETHQLLSIVKAMKVRTRRKDRRDGQRQ